MCSLKLARLQKLEENNSTYSGREKEVCLMTEAEISLFKFSPGLAVKSCTERKKSFPLPSIFFFFPLSASIPPAISLSCVAHLEFGGWRYGGHKSHCYWCGYEPQPNGDDSARSFSSAFPLQRWALDTVHLACHFPALHSAICAEPIRDKENF